MIPLGNFAFWLLGAAAFGIWFSGGLLAATDLSEDEGWRGTLLERTWLVCFAILALAAVLLTVGFVGAAVWAVLRAVFG